MFLSDIATIPQTFQLGSVGLVRPSGAWASRTVFPAVIPGSHLYFFFLIYIFCWVCTVTQSLPAVPVGLLYCSLFSSFPEA